MQHIKNLSNGSKVSDSFKGITLDVMQELIDQVVCNDLKAVEQNLKFNSAIIFQDERAQSLLKHAPTVEMVYTLLNYTPSKKPLPPWTESRDFEMKEIKAKIAKSNIKFFIQDLILLWPDVSREIFTDSVLFQGLSVEDENLEIYACTEVLKKCDSEGINLGTLLDLSCSDDDRLIRHLFATVCCHSMPIYNFWYRIHYLALALAFQSSTVMWLYVKARNLVCPSYDANYSLSFLLSIVYYVLCGLLVIEEIANVIIQKGRYFNDIHTFVKWATIFTTLPSLTLLSNGLMTFSIMLVWVNLFLSLRDSQIYGKYILMVIGVINTFVKVALLFAILLFCFTCSSNFLFYPSSAETALQKKINNDTVLKKLCNKTASDDESAARMRLEKVFDPNYEEQFTAKEFLSHINDAIGNTQISQTTVNNMAIATNDLSPIRTIAWLALSASITIVFMNLMIGLTVGDVEKIGCEANKSILQLHLKAMFIYYSVKRFFKYICCKLSVCCSEESKLDQIQNYFVIKVYAKPKTGIERMIQAKWQDQTDHPLSKKALKMAIQEFADGKA